MCPKCNTKKYNNEFSKNKSRPDGLAGYCKPCSYNTYKDSIIKRATVWQKNNKIRHSLHVKNWQSKNRNRINVNMSVWRENNRALWNLYQQKRRTTKAHSEGEYSVEEWLELCERFNNKCVSCNKEKPLTVDHVIPLSRGGSNFIYNIQPLCGSCNSKKHDKIIDFRGDSHRDILSD